MIKAWQGKTPVLAPGVRLAESAVLVGGVALGENVSVWYGAVVRGDESSITVGAGTNIQENAVLHCDEGFPLQLGQDVTVGHGAVVHGCTVGDYCTVGMGAILLNGCVIGESCIVAAGALVPQNKTIPARSLVMGSPARIVRSLSEEEILDLRKSAEAYRRLAAGQLSEAEVFS